MKVPKEVKIGIIVVAGVFLLLWGLNYLKGKNVFTNRKHLFVVYNNVGGLTVTNPVYYKGFVVGKVSSITILNDSKKSLLVEFALREGDLQIPKNTVAKIFSDGILGTKAIDLVFGDSQTSVESGDTLIADMQSSITEEMTKQVLPVKEKAERLMMTLDSLLHSLNNLFVGKTGNDLNNTFTNLASLSGGLDQLVIEQRARLRNISDHVQSITKNLANNNENLSATIKNLKQISDTLALAHIGETLAEAKKALAETSVIMSKINRGEGTMGMLVNNDSLYKSLTAASKDLDQLLIDLKANPKRYVHFSLFGKKDKKD